MALSESNHKNNSLLDVLYEVFWKNYRTKGGYAVYFFYGSYDVPLNVSGKAALGKSEEVYQFQKQGIDMITPAYNQFKSWAEEFDTATLEQKKMISCNLFKRIEVGRDYEIRFSLNMTYQQFCSEWGDGSFLNTTAAV